MSSTIAIDMKETTKHTTPHSSVEAEATRSKLIDYDAREGYTVF